MYCNATASSNPIFVVLVRIQYYKWLFFVLLRSTMQSFRENLEDQNEKHQYCNRVFGGWDYALSEEGTAVLKHRSLYKDLVVSVSAYMY